MALLSACAPPADTAPKSPAAGAWREFEGTWSAAGNRQVLQLGPDREVSVFRLTGSLLLSGEQRIGAGFRAQVIGLSDSRTGMLGRCVWTDERGNQVHSELKGDAVRAGGRITGTIVGGTGRYAGVTGEYSFGWQYVVDSGNEEVNGRVSDLKVRVKLPAVASGG